MKKRLSIVLVVVLTVILLLLGSTSVAYAGHISKTLPMVYYSESDSWCGPCSGTSIGQYYEDNYPDFPLATQMYDQLYVYMDTSPLGPTSPSNYGPGFVEMALHHDYDNFDYEYYDKDTVVKPGDEEFYMDVIRDAINNDWPIALAALNGFDNVDEISTDGNAAYWPVTKGHWIAIKGYDYQIDWGVTWDHHIICTDSYSHANNLVIDWDDVVAEVDEDDLYVVVIKDEDDTPDGPYQEDFEWGEVGDSLAAWQAEGGEVDWDVTTTGASKVEIDIAQSHTGTRSARFYRSTSNPLAKYSLLEPSFLGFEFKKDDNSEAVFRIGNGDWAIWFRVNRSEQIQYYDTSWHTVYTIPYLNDWYLIQFTDFDWDEDGGTFDIWVNDVRRKDDANMRSYTGYNGIFQIMNWGDDYSKFWIDDIEDLLPKNEDFEWKKQDGWPLDDDEWGCVSINWEVSTQGSSKAEIDTTYKSEGTRSGRWYRDGTNTPQAWFTHPPLDSPIGFYLRVGGGATAVFSHGDGTHRIYFLVQTNGRVVYIDEETYLSFNTWYHFEIKDINWNTATYDVWLDGERIGNDIDMLAQSACDGKIVFYSNSGTGQFWVDDISIPCFASV